MATTISLKTVLRLAERPNRYFVRKKSMLYLEGGDKRAPIRIPAVGLGTWQVSFLLFSFRVKFQ